MIHIATDTLGTLAAFPQDAAQATPDPAVKRRKRPLMAVFEILKPSLKRTVHLRRNSGQTCAVALCANVDETLPPLEFRVYD
jgi:hypothetical protein